MAISDSGVLIANTIQFGSDGWRGVIAEDYTFDNVRRAGFVSFPN
jgi:phosphomannomutase